MNRKDVENAIKALLAGNLPSPAPAGINWPNVSVDPDTLPRFEVSFPVKDTEDPTMKGNQVHREAGSVAIVVCTPLKQGTDAVNDYVDALDTLFYKGRSITVAGGTLRVVSKLTQSGAPYPDDASYRTPTLFRYVAVAS